MVKLTKKQEILLYNFLDKKNEYYIFLSNKFKIDFFNQKSILNLKLLEEKLGKKVDEETIIPLSFLIGEAIIEEIGGNWSIGIAKRDNAYNLPIILNWGDNQDNARFFPMEWIELFNEGKLRLEVFSRMILQNK